MTEIAVRPLEKIKKPSRIEKVFNELPDDTAVVRLLSAQM